MDLADLYNFIKRNKWNDTQGSPVSPYLGMIFQSPEFYMNQVSKPKYTDEQFARESGLSYRIQNDPYLRNVILNSKTPEVQEKYKALRRKYSM